MNGEERIRSKGGIKGSRLSLLLGQNPRCIFVWNPDVTAQFLNEKPVEGCPISPGRIHH